MKEGFAIWLTGLPASGKTSIARCLLDQLSKRGVNAVHLESDELRKILTPRPKYSPEERDWFYEVLVYIALLLTRNGLPVILDATANKRIHRQLARARIRQFLEVYVRCPLVVCMNRDPKGIYRHGLENPDANVPGLQDPYEEPEFPELVVDSNKFSAEEAALQILDRLSTWDWIK